MAFVKVPCTKKVTHKQAHCDEILAIWQAEKFGDFFFPGMATAPVEFWDPSDVKKTSEEYEKEGIFLFGMGGGRFDEHRGENGERKKGMSCALLVALFLGSGEIDMALENLLNFATRRDLKEANSDGAAFEIPELIKKMWRTGSTSDEIWEWAYRAFDCVYEDAAAFYTEASKDFKKAKTYRVKGPRGMITVVVGQSDDENFSKFARSRHGARAGIVIQMNGKKDGRKKNVQIYTSKRLGLDMSDSARILRVEEYKLQGLSAPLDWKKFWADLDKEEVPGSRWYRHKEGQMLLNGSLTHDEVPTKIPFVQIEQIVKFGVDPTAFAPSRKDDCVKGCCTSTESNQCPWFAYGLPRCLNLRGETLVTASVAVPAPAPESTTESAALAVAQ